MILHVAASCSAFQFSQGCTARLESETNSSGSVFHCFCLHGHGKCHSLVCCGDATRVLTKGVTRSSESLAYLLAGSVLVFESGLLGHSLYLNDSLLHCAVLSSFSPHKSSLVVQISSILHSFENLHFVAHSIHSFTYFSFILDFFFS